MQRIFVKFRLSALVLATAVLITACSGNSAGNGAANVSGTDSPGASSSPVTIKIGHLKETHSINVIKLPDFIDQKKYKVELVPFKQFAEVGRALQTGDIQFAQFGYQNPGLFLDAGYTDFSVIAGVYTGAEIMTVRKGVSVKTWKDLEGKNVGIPPNSFVELLFKASAKQNGVDLNRINFISFPGAGPPLLASLKNGDVDVMVAWEPNSGRAAADGYGEYSVLDLKSSDMGAVTSLFGTKTSWAQKNQQVVKDVVAALVKSTDGLNNNKEEWKKAVLHETGLEAPVAELSMAHGEQDYKLYLKQGQAVLKAFAAAGLMKADHSSAVVRHYDYSYLEAVTGKPKSDLGGG